MHQRFARRELGCPLLDPPLQHFVDAGELFLGLPRVCHVMGDADEADMLAQVAPARLRLRPQPPPLPVAAPETRLDHDRRQRPSDDRFLAEYARQIVGMDAAPPIEFERLLVGAAEEIEIGLVHEFAPAVGTGHPHGHGRAVGDGAEPRFALGDRAFGQFALGDVGDDDVHARAPGPKASRCGTCVTSVKASPVRSRKLDFVGNLIPRERPLEVGSARLVHLGAHHVDDAAPEDLAARAVEPYFVGLVDESEDLAAVDVGDQDGQGVGYGPQFFPALDRLLFGQLSFGNVDVRPD